MGQVLKTFRNGFPGTISRAVDDIVIAQPNKSGAVLPFGTPVALNPAKTGVVPFNPSTHTAADFIGVTVRLPSKTPDTYGSGTGAYAANDMADILVRGHIIVEMDSTSAGPGDAAAIRKSDGAFTVGTGDAVVPLTNVRVSSAPGDSGLAEILLTGRNKL